jgi:predicted regulator of Ras-like GTPase activity (Roadblock/LC7/MglB family)
MDELKSVLQRFLAVDRVALASVAGTDGLVIDSAGHQDELDADGRWRGSHQCDRCRSSAF